jgi:hypothetical protein
VHAFAWHLRIKSHLEAAVVVSVLFSVHSRIVYRVWSSVELLLCLAQAGLACLTLPYSVQFAAGVRGRAIELGAWMQLLTGS